MEPIGRVSEGEWSSLSGMSTAEEADFMAQLLSSCPVPSGFWASDESMINVHEGGSGLFCISDIANNANLYDFSQGSSGCYSGENCYLSDSHQVFVKDGSSMSMEFCIGDVTNTNLYLIEGDNYLIQEISNSNVEDSGVQNQPEASLPNANSQPEMDSEMLALEPSSNLPENSKKRSRASGDAQKNKRNVKSKKNQKLALANNDEESNATGLNAPVSSSCCSEDDSNVSQELNGGATSSMRSKGTQAVNLNGKTRASRGAATDPQSLYARKRRERINERLRILQNLVPNGTKVDISTMLEEAVHYVKFLQLQIKLLSSDDLWMYAPIAYNGMDIGLDLKINNTTR